MLMSFLTISCTLMSFFLSQRIGSFVSDIKVHSWNTFKLIPWQRDYTWILRTTFLKQCSFVRPDWCCDLVESGAWGCWTRLGFTSLLSSAEHLQQPGTTLCTMLCWYLLCKYIFLHFIIMPKLWFPINFRLMAHLINIICQISWVGLE